MSTDDTIVQFPGAARVEVDLDVDPLQMLKTIHDEFPNLETIAVVGTVADGTLLVFSSQSGDGDTLMLLERGKDAIMEGYRYAEPSD